MQWPPGPNASSERLRGARTVSSLFKVSIEDLPWSSRVSHSQKYESLLNPRFKET